MLQVARLSPKLLGDAGELVEGFLRSQLNPDGGFRNRVGESDLYYTVFGLEGLVALRAEPPVAAVTPYLTSFGDGEGLDFVHLACLARCWASVARDWDGSRVLARLEGFRTADGGYNQTPGAEHGTAYAAYLALGAYQDLRMALPEPERLLESLACFAGARWGLRQFARSGGWRYYGDGGGGNAVATVGSRAGRRAGRVAGGALPAGGWVLCLAGRADSGPAVDSDGAACAGRDADTAGRVA